MLAWQFGVPSATVEVACGDARHRVTWRRGKLVLEDHDLSSELALVGFGGECPPCLELLAQWQAVCGARAPLVLVNGKPLRRPGLIESLPPELARAATLARLVRHQRRWMEVAIEASWPQDALYRQLLGEFRDAVAASLLPSRQRRVVQRVNVRVRGLEPRQDPSLTVEVGRGTVRLEADLSVSWLLQVWGWELAAVDGAVVLEVLDADPADPSRLAVTVLRWEDGPIGRVTPVVATAWVEPRPAAEGVAGAAGPVGGGWQLSGELCDRRPRLWWSIDVRS